MQWPCTCIIIKILILSPISNVHRDTSSVDYIITITYIYNNEQSLQHK